MNKYSIWSEIIYYGEYDAETEWEARLIACDGDEDEAEDVQCCLIESD